MADSEANLLLAALAEAPDGLTRPELLARLRERIPHLTAPDVERVLQAASGAVRIDGDRIHVAMASE